MSILRRRPGTISNTYLIIALILSSALLLVSLVSISPLEIWEVALSIAAAAIIGTVITFQFNRSNSHSAGDSPNKTDGLPTNIATLASSRRVVDTKPSASADNTIESLDVMLISRDMSYIDRITQCLQTWGKSYTIVDNGVQAISKLMNENTALSRSGTVIVDTHNLDMDPYYMPSLVRKEPKLAGLRLLCLSDSLYREESQALQNAGYDGVIDTPMNTSQLFSLIEVQSVDTKTDNIVSLTHHRLVNSQRQSPKSILLAEQNTQDRKQLESTLRKAGHRVVSVTDGDQALDALERQSFHLAVINLQLPIMNGTQVVKLHRFTTPHRQWVPFIVITSQNTPATLRLCRELKIRACLFKPVPSTELLELVVSAPDTASTLGEDRDIESTHRSKTHFHHASLLDRKILNALEQLDDDHMFVTDLIKVFNEDCTRILQGMRESIAHNQADRFIGLCGILMDNSGQLGAFALYEMSANISHINHENFQSEAEKLLYSLTDTATMTTQAFQDYLREKQLRHIDKQ